VPTSRNTSIQGQLGTINGVKIHFAEEAATYADLVTSWSVGYATAGPR
jgi:hypothetical protein